MKFVVTEKEKEKTLIPVMWNELNDLSLGTILELSPEDRRFSEIRDTIYWVAKTLNWLIVEIFKEDNRIRHGFYVIVDKKKTLTDTLLTEDVESTYFFVPDSLTLHGADLKLYVRSLLEESGWVLVSGWNSRFNSSDKLLDEINNAPHFILSNNGLLPLVEKKR
jgi:hypothetical protein